MDLDFFIIMYLCDRHHPYKRWLRRRRTRHHRQIANEKMHLRCSFVIQTFTSPVLVSEVEESKDSSTMLHIVSTTGLFPGSLTPISHTQHTVQTFCMRQEAFLCILLNALFSQQCHFYYHVILFNSTLFA